MVMCPNFLGISMSRQHDSESGEFEQVYADEAFIDALDELGQAGTVEVAEAVGCGEKNAYRRLGALEEEGRVTSQTVGRAKLWELVEGPNGINPDDPFWSAETVSSGGPTDVSSNVDEYLYASREDE
jgi:hypothetical protein